MRKSYRMILIAILVIVVGIMVGIFISNKNQSSNLEKPSETKLAQEDNEDLKNEIQMVTTSNIEVKTSPNTLFVFQTYYKGCEHTTIDRLEIPKDCVNQTEEELQEKYKDWKVQEFTTAQVTFRQERDGICNEHYIIKENNGYIAIYTIDSFGKEILQETTEIVTAYLPETDRARLKEGIKVEGQENLNATIEDYE